LRGAPHRVEYFHQVDDPYSHLAAQTLGPLLERYEIEIVVHLVEPPAARDAGEPEMLIGYARKDAADIAPHYGLSFPEKAGPRVASRVALAQRILAGGSAEGFPALAVEVGEALWSDDGQRVEQLAERAGAADEADCARRLREGTQRRARLRHYSGAMFHYGGVWFWGVDRLHHLERRLEALGLRRPGCSPVAPRPATDPGSARDVGRVRLEFFPSLRSPYSAIVFDRTRALAERTGVELCVRPVLPMVMRGVPASPAKAIYIVTDTKREAECEGVAFGRIFDPIGRPVERCFALWPWAREQGRGTELFASYLRAVWAEGLDVSGDAGLRQVVERAGLSWEEAQPALASEAWRDELEENRLAMYDEMGIWGVPSYRVSGPEAGDGFSTWGQDRLWLVADELRRRIARA
jgi:2-hydroxychromene-2-carboxylate isomerase